MTSARHEELLTMRVHVRQQHNPFLTVALSEPPWLCFGWLINGIQRFAVEGRAIDDLTRVCVIIFALFRGLIVL